ncbi:unnamed protein product [Scytosiphon promiscuus]
MRIISWARLAPSLSSTSSRSAVTTMAAAASGTAASAPIWTGLLKQGIARHKHDPTTKYCQLATAALGGGASCRTWVFRGFYEDTGALKFITDRRSQKIPEIAADPAGEVCFYLKKTREQFRVKGRLQVVTADEDNEVLAKARLHQWTQISPASQASFATSLIPGLEISHEQETHSSPDGGDSAGSDGDTDAGGAGEGATKRDRRTRRRGGSGSGSDRDRGEGGESTSKTPVSDDFCLVLLWPHFVDHLRLGDGQTRNLHKIQGDRDGGGALLGAQAPESSGPPGATGAGAEEERREEELRVTWVTMAVNP